MLEQVRIAGMSQGLMSTLTYAPQRRTSAINFTYNNTQKSFGSSRGKSCQKGDTEIIGGLTKQTPSCPSRQGGQAPHA